MNKAAINRIRKNFTTQNTRLPVVNVLLWLVNNLTKVSIFFVVMGCFNLWFYLYRIDHLTLLPSMLTTPSTLVAISFSLAITIVAFFITLLMPTFFYSLPGFISEKQEPDRSVITHSFFISIFIAITGVFDSETACGLFIFILSGYCAFFTGHLFYGNWRRVAKIYLMATFINMAFIITLTFIYNKADLSGIERFYRFIIILSYMIICYLPMMAVYDFFKAKRSGKNNSLISSVVVSIMIFYVTLNLTPGFFVRANDYAISLAGLKSEQKNLFKVSLADYPADWFKDRWVVIYKGDKVSWIEGYAIFQNSNIKVICPTASHIRLQQKMIEETTIFNRLISPHRKSVDTADCIDIDNKSESTLPWKENDKF